jgi:putative Holliday junction resolvase
VLGFDYGSRLIGVALGNRLTHDARPLGVVAYAQGAPDWATIDTWMREWQPGALVVGLPLDLQGEEQKASRGARAFAQQLEQRYRCTVHLVDERMSSVEAARRFAARRASGRAKRKDAAQIDAIAAEIITETWLAQR